MSTTIRAFEGTFEVDRTHSSVQFAVRHMEVSVFRASFDGVEGNLFADDAGVRLEGRVPVESVSIPSQPPEFRDHVVRGADFFDAAAHPEVRFRSSSVELVDGRASVTGELTIRGLTRTVTALGAYELPVEDPYGARRASLELRATLDRRSWDMDWQAPLPSGGEALGWEVEVSANLELVQAA